MTLRELVKVTDQNVKVRVAVGFNVKFYGLMRFVPEELLDRNVTHINIFEKRAFMFCLDIQID